MDTLTFTPAEEYALRQLGVTAVILFGSHARGLAHTASDYDIGVIRTPETAQKKTASTMYDRLYDLLADKIGKLVTIDIVFLDEAPMELQHHVATYGQALFEAKPGTFASYKETVMDRYADFAPIRRMFQKHILGRIPA